MALEGPVHWVRLVVVAGVGPARILAALCAATVLAWSEVSCGEDFVGLGEVGRLMVEMRIVREQ